MESVNCLPVYSRLHVDGFDADALLGVVNGTRFEQRLLGGGQFTATLQRLQFPRCTLDCGAYSLPVYAQGGFGSEVMAIALAVRSSQSMWANGTEVECGRLMLFAEDHPLDVRSMPGQWQWCVVLIRRELLLQLAIFRHGREPALPQRGWQPVGPRGATNSNLRYGILRTLHRAAHWNERTPLQDVRAAEDQLLGLFVDSMMAALHAPPGCKPRADVRRSELLRRADAYMTDRMADDLSLSTLCAAMGIGPRQLERLFQQTHGLGPCHWLKLTRLNEARRRLRAGAAQGCVTSVAMQLGFSHLGRFAGEYKALFRETPRETLALARAEQAVMGAGFGKFT